LCCPHTTTGFVAALTVVLDVCLTWLLLICRSLLVYHKASLVATRDFWRLLTREVIPMERLGHSFKRIDEMEFMAEKTYKLVLDRYPTNAKMLKSYGKFLENVKVSALTLHPCSMHMARQKDIRPVAEQPVLGFAALTRGGPEGVAVLAVGIAE
jgi:hypothetical protein